MKNFSFNSTWKHTKTSVHIFSLKYINDFLHGINLITQEQTGFIDYKNSILTRSPLLWSCAKTKLRFENDWPALLINWTYLIVATGALFLAKCKPDFGCWILRQAGPDHLKY